jgi:hypothetical protein
VPFRFRRRVDRRPAPVNTFIPSPRQLFASQEAQLALSMEFTQRIGQPESRAAPRVISPVTITYRWADATRTADDDGSDETS